jgi:hypothetical protein
MDITNSETIKQLTLTLWGNDDTWRNNSTNNTRI